MGRQIPGEVHRGVSVELGKPVVGRPSTHADGAGFRSHHDGLAVQPPPKKRTPFSRSPSVTPVAQKNTFSPETRSLGGEHSAEVVTAVDRFCRSASSVGARAAPGSHRPCSGSPWPR